MKSHKHDKHDEERRCDNKSRPNPAKIAKGSHVAISYIGTLEDGEVFDRTEEKNPLMFTLGQGELLPAFEEALIGMKLDEEKDIRLEPKDAYGERNNTLVQEVPRNLLEGKVALEKGKKIMFSTPKGHAYAEILEISGASVKLDFNHPLAGKPLNFHVKVLEIS
jgi:FKBP-type peptidyl-prolyl cis-trans isomerase 2